MKFKVGDMVKIRNNEFGKLGKIGTITRIQGNSLPYFVDFTTPYGEDFQWSSESDMALIEPDEHPDDVAPATVEQPDVRFPAFEEDNVNHPPHYKHGEIETLDIIRMSLTDEEFRGFLKGNVLKYQMRAPFKHADPEEDYKKAKFYYDEYREVTE